MDRTAETSNYHVGRYGYLGKCIIYGTGLINRSGIRTESCHLFLYWRNSHYLDFVDGLEK